MDSIIVNQKKLQCVLFRAFSECLEINGNPVASRFDDDVFSWWLTDHKTAGRLSPNWEIPRKPVSSKFGGEYGFMIESMNPDQIITLLRIQFVQFRETITSGNPIKVTAK